MNEELFNELLVSVKQAKKIMDNKSSPSRSYNFTKPCVKDIRLKMGLSQSKFAALIGVSQKTVQNWEQGIREPRGAAKALLQVVNYEPEATLRALHFKTI